MTAWTTKYRIEDAEDGGEDRTGDLGEQRDALARAGPGLDGEIGDAEEERDRDHAQDDERLRRVVALRRLEGADAVRDRLDACERGCAGREGAE